MNMIQAFNDTLTYLETTLDGAMEDVKLRQLSGYSPAMFSRLFSILTNLPLTDYLRQRKLSEAAKDLRESRLKVIDLAVKYGYESAEAFSSAFRKFHGHSPSDVRKGSDFRVTPRIQLSLQITGGRNMNIRIQKKEGFTVAGLERTHIDSSVCPELWDRLLSTYSHETLAALGNGQSYGMCFDVQDSSHINYMAAYDVRDLDKARELKLDFQEIEAAEYAVLELQGPVPDCIHEGWKYAMEVFFPEQGYRHSGKPDFEVYAEGDMASPDYRMELWIPVAREN